jgi:hypothetical protein
MPAPTFVSETETAWAVNTAITRVTASISVQTGDVLVACMMGTPATNMGTFTASGGGIIWTTQRTVGTGAQALVTVATATASSTTSFTVTATRTSASSSGWGMVAMVFRAVQALGVNVGATGSSAAPTVNITTTAANSALVVANFDASTTDGAGRVWRSNAGALSETTYNKILASGEAYAGYHADAGAAGTYAVGLSAPAGQNYSIAALELQGVTGAATKAPPPFQRPWRLRRRMVIR